MNNQQFLTKLIVLALLKLRGTVDSSYFFNQVFARLYVTLSVSGVINELTKQGYISHEGQFEGTSGLVKNITLTDSGLQFLEDHPLKRYEAQYRGGFDQSELLTKLLES